MRVVGRVEGRPGTTAWGGLVVEAVGRRLVRVGGVWGCRRGEVSLRH